VVKNGLSSIRFPAHREASGSIKKVPRYHLFGPMQVSLPTLDTGGVIRRPAKSPGNSGNPHLALAMHFPGHETKSDLIKPLFFNSPLRLSP
jgi:hypothetical protein